MQDTASLAPTRILIPGHADDPDGIFWPCLALLGQTVALLVLTYVALRRKEE